MSKKFLSLIHGDQIRIAPGKKIISSETFSSLIDAKEALKKAQEDGEQYKKEIASESEKIKEQAEKEGFEKGYADWIDKIQALEEEIKKTREEMLQVILPIALKAAKKIVGRELETSSTTVVDIIANSLKSVSQHKKIKIYVNRKEHEIVEKNREQLRKIFENLEALSIQPQDDVQAGGCIIETEAGIINAQIDNQWMILETAFQRLLKKETAETNH